MTPIRRLWHQASGPGWGPLPELLLALTLVTGLVDAVSILALGRVFVANMTGNVVFAGFAIAGAPGFSLSASAFALAGFLIGAALGGRLTRRVGHDRALHLRAATAAELGLVVVALVIAATSGDPAASHGTLHLTTVHLTAGHAGPGSAPVVYFGTAVTDALALVLAVAMGIQNSAARKLAVPDLTTTVLTMTLTGIGADSRSGQRGNLALARRLLAVAIMLGGGILGAWLVLQVSATAAVAVAAGLLLVAAACAALAARTPAPWRPAGPAPARTAVASPGLPSAGAVDHELARRVGQGTGGDE
ncbi:MAG TPA: YoaK family protein [Trebonia sp.]